MAAPQVLQGTWEELSVHAALWGTRRLTLVIPAEDETEAQPLRQPEEVKTAERLEELLLSSLASPSREMTAEDWAERIRRAEKRIEETNR